MAVSKKVVTGKTTPVKAAKPKAPPKPKFGQLGYQFNIKATIVEVSTNSDCPFNVEVDLGDFDDWEDAAIYGKLNFHFKSIEDLTNLICAGTPGLAKSIKREELNKAKVDVARLTKELAAIK